MRHEWLLPTRPISSSIPLVSLCFCGRNVVFCGGHVVCCAFQMSNALLLYFKSCLATAGHTCRYIGDDVVTPAISVGALIHFDFTAASLALGFKNTAVASPFWVT